MSDLRTAAQQALEALVSQFDGRADAIDILRAALAQQAEHFCDTHCTWADHAAGCVMAEPAAKVELMTTGGNAGLATRIVEIDDHLRERLRPGQLLYTTPPQRKPLTEKEMYAVEEEARKNFRLSQKGPRGQQITYWDGLTPWLIRAVELAHGIKE